MTRDGLVESEPEQLSGSVLRALQAVVCDGYLDDPGPGIAWSVLDALGRLLGCDVATFCDLDDEAQYSPLVRDRDGACHQLVQRDSLPDADLAWSTTPARCWCQSVPIAPGIMRRVLLWRRGGSDFTDRDEVILQLLRPHLQQIFLAAARRHDSPRAVTTREYQVLELVAMGCTTAEIGHRLFISPATVRKHLEHVFNRTGIHDRAAAASLVLAGHQADSAQVRTGR
jgi:DNA-binding CsgD family transcriptional regulator